MQSVPTPGSPGEPRKSHPTSLTQLIDQLDLANVQMSEHTMLAAIYRARHPRAQVPWKLAWTHIDNNAHDFAEFVQVADGLDKAAAAVSLLAVTPKSPFAKAVIIEKDWVRAKEHLAEWEQEASGSPAILAALARRYAELGKIEEAQRALMRYIRFSPDYWAYQQLAKQHKDAGDLAQWESTLKDYLVKSQEHGLTHAQVQVELARHFMELKQFDKAWTYAEAAANSSGAQWALTCASECALARNDWQPAETYAQQVSRRYPRAAWAYWYLFCVKSGHGDLAAARSFVENYLKPINERPELAGPAAVGYFQWLSGDTKTAMLWFRQAYSSSPTVYTCFNLILLADEIGDTATRDEAIRILLTNFRRQGPVACRIYEILRRSLHEGAAGSVDLEAVDAILENVPPASQGLNSYLVGLFLKNHGKPADCRRYLERALKLPGSHEWSQAKARQTSQALDGKDKPAAPRSEQKN
jgi:tetratricopeptide (TPR) repeat protein